MTLRWIAFIESNTSGTGRLFARAAIDQGLRPVILSADVARYDFVECDGLDSRRVDTDDIEALVAACRGLVPAGTLVGVTSSSEYFVATAAALARRLGLPGADPDAIRECRDKWKPCLRLEAAGVGVPQFQVAASGQAAAEAAREMGLPVVVKPVSGSGSMGVKLCERAEDASTHATALLREEHNERGQLLPRYVLVEQLIAGPEYSVETMGTNVIGITSKRLGPLPHFVEVGHDFPALLSAREDEIILQTAHDALKALKLGWGPAHVEIRLGSSGPKIIEVNPRLAGGFIPELVRLACGIDMIAEAIRRVSGGTPHLERTHRRYASLRFILAAEDGVLSARSNLDAAAQVPGVVEARMYLQAGAPLSTRGDFRDRVGHIIAVGETPEIAQESADQAHAEVNLVVEPAAKAETGGS
jgi:argininosuccinate lyase